MTRIYEIWTVGMERLTLQEAARRLGISEGAVRKRFERGTLRGEKGEDGRVYVFVDAGVMARPDELVEALRDEITHLRREIERKDAMLRDMIELTTEAMRALAKERKE